MNSRDYKTFRRGYCYHIYNRGDNKENIFITPEDYEVFLEKLKVIFGLIEPPKNGRRGTPRFKSLPKGSFTLIAYCLMPNHYHFEIRQNTDIPLSLLVAKLCTSYAKYFNKKYHRVGNLFQDTFKAKLVELDGYLVSLSAYIHTNPTNIIDYPYSSLYEYKDEVSNGICDPQIILEHFKDRQEYLDYVKNYNKNDESKIKDIVFGESD